MHCALEVQPAGPVATPHILSWPPHGPLAAELMHAASVSVQPLVWMQLTMADSSLADCCSAGAHFAAQLDRPIAGPPASSAPPSPVAASLEPASAPLLEPMQPIMHEYAGGHSEPGVTQLAIAVCWQLPPAHASVVHALPSSHCAEVVQPAACVVHSCSIGKQPVFNWLVMHAMSVSAQAFARQACRLDQAAPPVGSGMAQLAAHAVKPSVGPLEPPSPVAASGTVASEALASAGSFLPTQLSVQLSSDEHTEPVGPQPLTGVYMQAPAWQVSVVQLLPSLHWASAVQPGLPPWHCCICAVHLVPRALERQAKSVSAQPVASAQLAKVCNSLVATGSAGTHCATQDSRPGFAPPLPSGANTPPSVVPASGPPVLASGPPVLASNAPTLPSDAPPLASTGPLLPSGALPPASAPLLPPCMHVATQFSAVEQVPAFWQPGDGVKLQFPPLQVSTVQELPSLHSASVVQPGWPLPTQALSGVVQLVFIADCKHVIPPAGHALIRHCVKPSA